MGYKAAMQVLKQADDLKPKVLKKSDLLSDSEAWTNQQKLQNIYHQVLVLDLEYALDKKVEQDLWNVGFKNHIADLQENARDKKNSRRSDFQALLTWALESASGFYLTLLQELCNTFDIDLPFRRSGIVYGQITTPNEQNNVPQFASCSYICQYCLVHLGDIARYRSQRRQAESFYKQAILVSPSSGHPYNQLALLEASQGDKLSTVFYYIRGICVKNPFPASTTNLMSILTAAIDKESPFEKIQTKMTVNEYIQLFLCTHGYFHTVTDIKQAQLAVKSLNSVMTALVATQSFKKEELIKITVINLYAIVYLNKEDELTEDEVIVKELILELIAGSLSAFLMPVYTLKNDESLLEYYALPAVKFLMYFIFNNSEYLKCQTFKERMQIWPSLCKLVNRAQQYLKTFNYCKFRTYSLKEDKDLEGFLPLNDNLKNLDCKEELEDTKLENMIRMRRIIDFADWLSGLELDGVKLITKTENKGITCFEPSLSQPDPTKDLLEEMKSFTIQDVIESKFKIEKKAGILKPQGSLEKAREEREVKISVIENSITDGSQKNIDLIKNKRPKQNVALQSIFKKMEENKQVKFSIEESSEKDKSVKFEQPPPLKVPQSAALLPPVQNNQFSNPPPALRTQSFNQNHPAFPAQPVQPPPPTPNQVPTDYLTSLRNLGKGAENSMMPQFSKNTPFSNLPPPSIATNTNAQVSQAINKMQNFHNKYNMSYNSWGRDDVKFSSGNNQNSWWGPNPPVQSQGFYPNHPQPNQNYMQQRPPENPAFGGMPFTQFNPQYQRNSTNNSQFDFLGSSWSNVNRGNSFGIDDTAQSSMSMRQAMLKEAPLPASRTLSGDSQQMGGYSLFNNSWTPNLPGSFRGNTSIPDNSPFNGPQHSLFGGHGPQSLAQLLEHQQNQMGGNPILRNNPNSDSK
ncbi:hypothetical protein GWI33_004371 [Rhynchophorus ferrugineus]|uniref:Protein SMG7 n=1 Tax=Rhynchophorus ferrugineus TaxID=354439 RepID=A0A834IZ95_RHYFE|nr:hypothetical protein GWI33_004371 [Rhynchophorus ferrugineus]